MREPPQDMRPGVVSSAESQTCDDVAQRSMLLNWRTCARKSGNRPIDGSAPLPQRGSPQNRLAPGIGPR